MSFRASDWILLAPELVLTSAGLLLMVLGISIGKAKEEFLGFLAVLSVVATGIALALAAVQPGRGSAPILGGMFILDNFALFFKLLILLSLALTVLASVRFVGSSPYAGGEYYALVLFAGVGMLFMVSGTNLASIYIALELMALSSYVLAGYFKGEPKSTEAALKYFILGAFSSGVLLYGISLVYGLTGKLGLTDIAGRFASAERSNLTILGILLILAGLLFKVAAVPFHVWAPDVYEGAPTPVTAFFSAAPKVAAVALFVRVAIDAFPTIVPQWQQITVFLSIASMGLGAFAAIGQRNIKRLMAYSSIGHVGYALIGLSAATPAGVQGVLVYM
ncbi:MAG TPA: NADH-quinone oxidoreductase subunit N, partial [Thermoanaerobaculia bacterium]|nr:NADH-quinone oxidoreductase subunit N [Thermoanaerobaculia bacterium]